MGEFYSKAVEAEAENEKKTPIYNSLTPERFTFLFGIKKTGAKHRLR
jgi:hypothetical protein